MKELIDYAVSCGLITEDDRVWAENRLLELLKLDEPLEIPGGLKGILEYAVENGLCENNITDRDLFDTKIMSIFTPAPHEVREKFRLLYEQSPEAATDWYYKFSQDTNYIRRDRIEKDIKWLYSGKYGELEITINLSKPEKDPKAIAAAKAAPQTAYPKCQLCAENEGYAGRMNHPARQNLRLIPVTINGGSWFWQYSPYVYYNEHCIVFNSEHIPMKIDRSTFIKLFDFIKQYPHYMLGSNADLPIVGGSILSHDHFQGGRHEFPMAKAGIRSALTFTGFEDVSAGIVNWPMSVIRISSGDSERLIALADKILRCWRRYSDKSAFIFSETYGEPHSTITPIARKRGDSFELDLILRNNITTAEFPLGVYHPHPDKHHIKKENIGLIECLGLAILPPRLKPLLEDGTYSKEEIGAVFEAVLEDCGVFKEDSAFMRFIESVNKTE